MNSLPPYIMQEDRITLTREFPRVFSEGYNEVELPLILKDGTKVPYFLTGTRVIVDGKPHLVGIGIDITEKKKHEQALLKSEDVFKRAEEVAHMGSWQLDIGKNDLFWSDEVYRIFGIPITENFPPTSLMPETRSLSQATPITAVGLNSLTFLRASSPPETVHTSMGYTFLKSIILFNSSLVKHLGRSINNFS